MHTIRRPLVVLAAAVLALTAAACSSSDDTAAITDGGDGGSITVYSGRSEELVAPLFEEFTAATGIKVNARYGDTAELAAQILEEGGNSPADVFFAQDAGALGAVAAAGDFTELTSTQLDAVPEPFRSPDGLWVGVSGRARVVVYNTDLVDPETIPTVVQGFVEPEWAGRVGWAPTNGSFQSFVTAMRVVEGEDVTAEWLAGMAANNTQDYEKNSAILAAVANGEIEVGLVNHYYLFQYLKENPDAPVANAYGATGQVEALVNVAGVGILASARNTTGASTFVDYLLSAPAQAYFAERTYEYPLAAGVPAPTNLPPLASLGVEDLDLSRLEDLAGTLALLQQQGVV